jgi:hypothetical protein
MKAPNMAGGNDDDPLAKEYERNTLLEHICAGVLVIGLAAELVNAVIWFEGAKTIAEMFAVSLIVLGVAGEVWFGNRARIAGDKQMVQDRARAAEANQKAQEAALELFKFREPRAKLLTPENCEKMLTALSPFAGTRFVVGHDNIDRETWDFLWGFEPILAKAGWVLEDWIGGQVFGKNNWPGNHVYGLANAMNVSVELKPQDQTELGPAAEALAAALRMIGIDAIIAGPNNTHLAEGDIQLLVGPKR